MYANVYTALKLAAFQQAQVARQAELRRQTAARNRLTVTNAARVTQRATAHALPRNVSSWWRSRIHPA